MQRALLLRPFREIRSLQPVADAFGGELASSPAPPVGIPLRRVLQPSPWRTGLNPLLAAILVVS